MAKKSTWEKRASKVKKEEHIVLGGNTNRKKQGVKKKYPSSGEGGGYKGGAGEKSGKPSYTITREGDDAKKTSRDDSRGGSFKGNKGGGFKGKDKPFSKFRKDEKDGAFKGKGTVKKSFSQDDRKKSHTKFLKDQHFDGFEQRGQGPDDLIRLNKYLSMAGVCSRREADKFIEDGLVTINGEVCVALGTKVKSTDDVRYAGERVKAEALKYVLLNKPKDCITTLSDERDRSTVMGLVKNACRERIFPVGRLDRNTTGLILITNDGDMAKKLSHPSQHIPRQAFAEKRRAFKHGMGASL